MADGEWVRTVASLLDLWLWRLTAGGWRLAAYKRVTLYALPITY
jgi:hypothetical protein